MAIGSYGPKHGDQEGLIETLAGGLWKATRIPLPAHLPPGPALVVLDDVTCMAVGSCVVVGDYETEVPDNQKTVLFVDTLSPGKKKWSSATLPLPADGVANAPFDSVNAVSCTAPGACVAVGTYDYDGNQSHGLIDTLSGGAWTATSISSPTNTAPNQSLLFTSVACPADGSCVATGLYNFAPGQDAQAVTESLSDGAWIGLKAPLPLMPEDRTTTATSTPWPVRRWVRARPSGTTTGVSGSSTPCRKASGRPRRPVVD